MNLFTNAPKRLVKIGGVLHVHVGADTFAALDKKIEAALAKGGAVTENGITRWVDVVIIFNRLGETPSDRYIWHGDGERVKAERWLVTKTADGGSRKLIGTTWVKL